MSRSYSLFVSLCMVSTLCWRPAAAFELRHHSASSYLNTHITPNARTFQHPFEEQVRCHQRQSQYTNSLFAQPSDVCLEENHGDENSNHQKNKSTMSRRQRLRTKLARISKTLLLASTLTVALPKEAQAKFSHELTEEKTLSLRPGVSQAQATQLNEGEIPDDLPEAPKSIFSTERPEVESAQKQKKNAVKKKTFDYGDDEEDDDFDLEDEDYFLPSKMTAGRTSVAKSDVQKSNSFQAKTKSSFAGVAKKSQKEQRIQTLKVAVGAFIPTFGAMFVREFVRRRKEENYVQKGLEILEAQKAEYFNVTETTADSDIEDELKDLKDEDGEDDEDEDDEDDEDDDEEDNDDEDEPPSRRPPKRPTGGGDSGGSGSGDGDGRPSEDDLKRLGDIFNKS